MRKLFSTLSFFLIAGMGLAFAQVATQTVRGKITDAASKSPVVGAAILIVGSEPPIGVSSDADGNFRLPKVNVGRVSLKITYVGYEDLFIKDIIVNAGKETILDLSMTESLHTLNEVTVTYKRTEDARVTNNEMTTLSARPFNPSETLKYAGSLGDPSRMASNFAGVSGANDARNDIVVRGNSPSSLLWRLDGVNIPNPNHFSAIGTTGGPVSMLNANLLAKSDFLSGAFPSEYANALGSVFDLRLRKGNDEKSEFLLQSGFNGLEVGAEGPYSKKSKASYLINYRYSFVALMESLGFQIAGAPYYQDFTFKTDIPVGKKGTLTAWTIGGKSNVNFYGKDVDTEGDAYGDENENTRVKFSTGIAAVSYEHRFTDRTYGKLTLSGSRSTQHYQGDTVIYNGEGSKEVLQEIQTNAADFINKKLSAHAYLSHKISAKDKISGGIITDMSQFELANKEVYPIEKRFLNTNGNTLLLQGYAQWKHRFNEKLTMNAGLSGLYYQLNTKSVLEPRLGFSYALTPASSLNVAYGLHSNLQPINVYFYQSQLANGTYLQTNKDLGFTRSHHFVVGYERSLGENLRLKVESYYQSLFNVPVEKSPSYYSILTEGADFNPISVDSLVNTGTGRNYGLEVTLEKYFSNNYYFLITSSLFDSRYKGSDGIERNTPFNSKYVVNLLAGKEFHIGHKDNVLTINWKLTTAGGRYIQVVDLARSAEARSTVFDESQAYTRQQATYFRTDVKIGFKMNRKRATHELAIDLQNVTNHQNIFQQAYNPRTNRIGTAYQQGFLPVPFYRLTF